jgi:RNA polymerase sigma factor (sigma-70 family)
MAASPDTLLRYIRRLVLLPDREATTDAALLSRYVSRRDEKAFAAIVHRHGPLVFRVCRRVLGNVHDAEDAFQAAFLVLSRKAAVVHPRAALAAWLHGVAHRVALKARSAKARQFSRARPLLTPPADPSADPLAEISARDMLAVVDEEVRRLPEMFRLPVILCCLEGRSQEEAARQLGWTPGSVKGRLERGRARLHDRLVRRGLTLSAALTAVELSRSAVTAAVVAQIGASTVRAAMVFASEQTTVGVVSAQATGLAREVVRGMALAKLKLAAALMLTTGLLVTGFLLHRADLASREAPSSLPAVDQLATAVPPALARNQPAESQDDDNAPIEVSGRVLDTKGNPFAGAKLYVGYSARRNVPDLQMQQPVYRLRDISGTDGRFHFTFTKSDLTAKWLDDSRPAVVAIAGGYGPNWAEIGDAGSGPDITLKLAEDLPVSGRILDQDGRPIVGAKVRLLEVMSDSEAGLMEFLRGDNRTWYPQTWKGTFPEQPPSVATDADGRFQLTGVGRSRMIHLALEGPTVWHTSFNAITLPPTSIPPGWRNSSATVEYRASPSQSIRGVVRDKVTGRPVGGVSVLARKDDPPTLTDEEGRFELDGCSKNPCGYCVMAQPETGQPYFAASTSAQKSPGFDPLKVDLELLRGIPLSGHIRVQATGKPPRTAVVEYYPLFPNPFSNKLTQCPSMPASSAVIRPDGSYCLAVLPGPGVVCVAASPRNSYAVARVDDKELADLFPDGKSRSKGHILQITAGGVAYDSLNVEKYNAILPIHPDEKTESLEFDLTVQGAHALQGTVVGPDGQPLSGVEVVGLMAPACDELLNGPVFSVTGLNPRCTRDLSFRHLEKRLGRVLTIPGDETGPLTVQLEPCGTILGRLVDKGGKPVPGVILLFNRGATSFDESVKTDSDGRFRGSLLPGQKYSIAPFYGNRRLVKEVRELVVESGENRDLGDLYLGD